VVVTMGPVNRFVRRALNPLSTGLTNRWYGGFRQLPPSSAPPRPPAGAAAPTVRAMRCVKSPGDWVVPPGERPGWSWLPEHGAIARPTAAPRWVHLWSMLPFVDRYAYSWMWWHGYWFVPIDETGPPPPPAGVREPRRPLPPKPTRSLRLIGRDD